jgi:hypothetical protein
MAEFVGVSPRPQTAGRSAGRVPANNRAWATLHTANQRRPPWVVKTPASIAKRLSVELHRIEYLIASRGWAGRCRIFSDESVEFLAAELRKIETERGAADTAPTEQLSHAMASDLLRAGLNTGADPNPNLSRPIVGGLNQGPKHLRDVLLNKPPIGCHRG